MVHCGYEATAVTEAVTKPWKMLSLALFGIKTSGKMAPDLSLANQRPAEYVFSSHVEKALAKLKHAPKAAADLVDAAD
jgi:hypothetical protein